MIYLLFFSKSNLLTLKTILLIGYDVTALKENSFQLVILKVNIKHLQVMSIITTKKKNHTTSIDYKAHSFRVM